MFKKILSLTLVALMALTCLAACSNDPETPEDTDTETDTTVNIDSSTDSEINNDENGDDGDKTDTPTSSLTTLALNSTTAGLRLIGG